MALKITGSIVFGKRPDARHFLPEAKAQNQQFLSACISDERLPKIAKMYTIRAIFLAQTGCFLAIMQANYAQNGLTIVSERYKTE